MSEEQKQYITMVVVLLGFILFEIIIKIINKIKVYKCTEEIKTTAVDCERVYRATRGEDINYYHVIVEFEVDGKMYRAKSFSKRISEYEVGEKIYLKYSPKNPELCYDYGADYFTNLHLGLFEQPIWIVIRYLALIFLLVSLVYNSYIFY